MPDDVSVIALRAIAESHELLNEHARALEHSGRVQCAKSGLDIRLYDHGLTVELFLESVLADGSDRCWWLAARRQDSGTWIVESELLSNDQGSQRVVAALPPAEVGSTAVLASQLGHRTRQLLTLSGR